MEEHEGCTDSECAMCNGASIDELMKQYKELADKHGCSIVGVQDELTHCYSLGLAKKGFPDIFIIGPVEHSVFFSIINNIHQKWSESGLQLGRMRNVIGNDLDVDIQPVKECDEFAKEYVQINLRFYHEFPEYYQREEEVPYFVQVVLPDANNVMPYEAGYREGMPQPIFIDFENSSAGRVIN